VVGRRSFSDLLTVGGRLYYETHFAPLLSLQGEIGGVALDLRGADGTQLPVLVSSAVKTSSTGEPLLIRTTIFDASDRRAYERELLRARREADLERERLQVLVTTLQRSLLPPELPTVRGLETAAYYHIASLDEVGGDFYDLFPLSHDRWGLFLGNVCGKGARAAALTSLIRTTPPSSRSASLRPQATAAESPDLLVASPTVRSEPFMQVLARQPALARESGHPSTWSGDPAGDQAERDRPALGDAR
jgi:phosphoserine phosphatase RsbU/P